MSLTLRDAPEGLKPFGKILSCKSYPVDADAGTIYKNAPVVIEDDGNVAPATAGSGNKILGTAMSYKVTGAAGRVLVADHPDQKYVIQNDSDGGTPAQADVGQNADFIVTDTPNGYCSTAELDYSSMGTGSTVQLRILGKQNSYDWGAYVNNIVKINYHQLDNTTGV